MWCNDCQYNVTPDQHYTCPICLESLVAAFKWYKFKDVVGVKNDTKYKQRK